MRTANASPSGTNDRSCSYSGWRGESQARTPSQPTTLAAPGTYLYNGAAVSAGWMGDVVLTQSRKGPAMPQTRAHPRATHLSLAFRRRALLVIVLLLFSGLSLLDAALAHPVASPNAGAANTERFTGPTFVDVWWDPAAISGCASISLYRDGVEVDTPACGAWLVTDSGLSEGTSYSYQFMVMGFSITPAQSCNSCHTSSVTTRRDPTIGGYRASRRTCVRRLRRRLHLNRRDTLATPAPCERAADGQGQGRATSPMSRISSAATVTIRGWPSSWIATPSSGLGPAIRT